MKKFKKGIALLLVVVLALSGLVACGAQPEADAPAADAAKPTEAPKAENPDAQVETTADGRVIDYREDELEFWMNEASQNTSDVVNAIIADFNEQYPNVKVNVSYLSRDQWQKNYTLGAVSGELPDIGWVDGPETAGWIQMGILQDITDEFAAWEESSHYLDGPLKGCIWEGRQYAIPTNSNCLALWYDKDMLDAAGVAVPTTWDELLVAAEKLTTDTVKGFAMCLTNDEQGTFQILPHVISAGGAFDNLNCPETVKAISTITEMYQKGYMSTDCVNWGQSEIASQFAAGNVAMCEAGPWSIGVVDNPEKNWGVAVLPKFEQYASCLGGENIAIFKGADKELCWDFLKTWCSGQNCADYNIAQGRFMPRDDSTEYSNYWNEDPLLAAYNEQMKYAQPRGPHPRWSEFSSVFSAAVQEAVTGAKTPEQAMADAQKAADAIFAG